MAHSAPARSHRLYSPTVKDVVGNLRSLEFPWVPEQQPLFGVFLLQAVLDDLAEQPVVIADAITIGRQAKTRHALHKARGEPAEAAIPQGRIGLERAHPVVIDAEVLE